MLLKIKKKKLSFFTNKKNSSLTFNTVFGQMPDWNPAEMIGKTSKPLAISLYKNLITNNVWSEARKDLGYYKPLKTNLMETFFYQPYINTKLSFESFTPKNISKNLRIKIVNHWLDKLRKYPHLHDKVEFDIAITCYSFDIDEKIRNLLNNKINKKEKKILIKEYLKLTNKILLNYSLKGLKNELTKIEKLKIFQNEIYKNKKLNINIEDIKKEINLCKRLGTKPFSKLARYGFIAETLLKSLVNKNILSSLELKKFLLSIKTIASELSYDLEKLRSKNVSKQFFLKKYGHLRPGTYDICSKRYDESSLFRGKFNLKKNYNPKKNVYFFKKETLNKINLILNKNSINIKSNDLIGFIKDSIKAREYSKFIFTKSISNILKKFQFYFKKINLSRDDLSYLNLEDLIDFLENKNLKKIKNKILKNKEIYKKDSLIRLPLVFSDLSSLEVIPFQINSPNFITNKKVVGQLVQIKNSTSYKLKNILSGNIVLIEGADPGYDWIFSFNIRALITKFGGINSHMSIRCAEFGLPAIIGCGEQIFHKLESSNSIILNCETKKIEIIN